MTPSPTSAPPSASTIAVPRSARLFSDRGSGEGVAWLFIKVSTLEFLQRASWLLPSPADEIWDAGGYRALSPRLNFGNLKTLSGCVGARSINGLRDWANVDPQPG